MRFTIFDDMSLCTEAEVQRLLPLVSVQRRETALRYKHVFGQWTSLKSWLMLSELGVTGEWQFNEYGKPFVTNGPHFSLSHCKNGIAVAVDAKPIGIDIESIRAADKALIERTMNKHEQETIAMASRPDVAFIRLWTQKEAYLKYLGTGIIDDLHHVLDNSGKAVFKTEIKKDYVYTICYEED